MAMALPANGTEVNSSCALCNAVARGAIESWNEPILETENFVVIPSLGSLVEGWLLLVPRHHVLSVASLPVGLRQEFEFVRGLVGELMVEQYGSCCFFEHGPAAPRRATGCGVDHAHMHALPKVTNLVRSASPHLPPTVAFKIGDLTACEDAIGRGLDYLYVADLEGQSWVAVSRSFGSQTFRKAIATALGDPERFDWRSFPEVANIELTKKRLGTRSLLAGARSL